MDWDDPDEVINNLAGEVRMSLSVADEKILRTVIEEVEETHYAISHVNHFITDRIKSRIYGHFFGIDIDCPDAMEDYDTHAFANWSACSECGWELQSCLYCGLVLNPCVHVVDDMHTIGDHDEYDYEDYYDEEEAV